MNGTRASVDHLLVCRTTLSRPVPVFCTHTHTQPSQLKVRGKENQAWNEHEYIQYGTLIKRTLKRDPTLENCPYDTRIP